MEQLDDDLRKTEAWHKQLLEIAAADVPGIRSAILSEEAFAGLESMLRMHHVITSNYAGDLKPARILAFLPETRTARSGARSATSASSQMGWFTVSAMYLPHPPCRSSPIRQSLRPSIGLQAQLLPQESHRDSLPGWLTSRAWLTLPPMHRVNP
jgi:hypothetical protein